MKKATSIFISLLLLNCSPPDRPEKVLTLEKQYEQITRVRLPKNFKVISNPSSDPEDLLKTTVLELSKTDCMKFIKRYRFRSVRDTLSPLLFGSMFMDSIYRSIPDRNNFLHLYGRRYGEPNYYQHQTEKSANWVYLVDTTTCRVYCLISNADMHGYAK